MLPVNETAASLALLLFVLIVASWWGLLPAIVTSIAATLLFNFYFLPPVGTLTIADPQNWLALVAFLITAVIASELSNRAQKQAAAAVEQRREVERLYELSRAVLLETGEGTVGAKSRIKLRESSDLNRSCSMICESARLSLPVRRN